MYPEFETAALWNEVMIHPPLYRKEVYGKEIYKTDFTLSSEIREQLQFSFKQQ